MEHLERYCVHPDHPNGHHVEQDLARLDRGLPTTGRELPAYKVRRRVRIAAADVLAYLESTKEVR